MQYNKNEDGSFTPLAQQNVDTGMGLERVAAVLQGKKNVYETDSFLPIMNRIAQLSPTPEGWDIEATQVNKEHANELWHRRIIADHLKAATFMISDGVRPSNVDQGYILRRLIRRAIRSYRILNQRNLEKFCEEIAGEIIDQYGSFYLKLYQQESEIFLVLHQEEESFTKALNEGTKHFQRVAEKSESIISGIDAFHLYDTYGFPIEMTKEMALESGKTVDEAEFTKAFEAHQALSRAGAEKKFSGGLADHSAETTKLHTATHLLNAALRKVLGDHVWQKGSNITTERLRFDFSHAEKMTPEQIKQTEDLVNAAIKADVPISYSVMTVDEAKTSGAIGVFENKYGDKVKVYTMGSFSQSGSGVPSTEKVFSREICGGPHVARTGMLGRFTIQKEESSSSGVRRMKAVVSGGPKEIEMAEEV
jgi:alanyl-tRNA synthetase